MLIRPTDPPLGERAYPFNRDSDEDFGLESEMTDLLDIAQEPTATHPKRASVPAKARAKKTAPASLPVVQEAPTGLLSAIVMLAKDQSVDVAKLDAILQMQERLEQRQAERDFNEAFIRLAPKLPRIKKNGTLEYPVDKNKPDGEKRKIANFAKYEDIDDGIRAIVNGEGFVYSFNTAPRQGEGGGLLVTCILRHAAGHSTETSIPVPLDSSGGKNNLQGYGSTLSYGKRYALCAALNIVTESQDDDGATGGIQYINGKQIAEIRRLLAETKSDEIRFAEWVGVAEIEDMTQAEFTKAINALQAKKQTGRAAA